MDKFFKLLFGTFSGPLFLFIGLAMMYTTFRVLNINVEGMLTILIALSPLWLPIGLFFLTFERWQYYVRLKFIVNSGRTTLRIKLPQEVFKSPEAMENVLNQTFLPNSLDNLMHPYLEGRHPLMNSLEVVSIGGEVRFYVNVPTKKVKNSFEAQLYAQYPGVEVTEEPIDYTAEVKWDPEEWAMISFHIAKKEDEIFPIKTYIDFGLDKLPKEEEKLDPMAPLLEHLGKVKPHERMWVQFLIRPHVKKSLDTGDLKEKPTWEKAVATKVSEIMGRDKKREVGEDGGFEIAPRLTANEKNTIDSMERNATKYAYETAIRAIYITKQGKFDAEMITPLLRAFSQFDVVGQNALGVRWRTDVDYPMFQDPGGALRNKMKKSELDAYKKRYYYPADVIKFVDKPKVMSVEEIATMYHLPGKVILTPSVSRIGSVRKEAPANLPVGTPTHLPV
ncbi:MAG: hypothetical protein AAB388_01870 [Patescibacteria group bacterium]